MADFEDDIDGQGAAGGTPGTARPSSGPGSVERQTFDTNVERDVERDIQRAHAALGPLPPPAIGGFRHIDPYPGMSYVNPIHPHSLTLEGLRNFLDGLTIPDYGPHITFVNDQPKNPSPDQPVTDATARMVEHGVVDSGVRSVNLNSTTGGHPNSSGNHPPGKAVDINNIDGYRVKYRPDLAAALQDTFARQSNIRENFGPGYQRKTLALGEKPVPWPQVKEGHTDHDHFGGQR
jgi:hypothetical protein